MWSARPAAVAPLRQKPCQALAEARCDQDRLIVHLDADVGSSQAAVEAHKAHTTLGRRCRAVAILSRAGPAEQPANLFCWARNSAPCHHGRWATNQVGDRGELTV
jgi:hypothetical protein